MYYRTTAAADAGSRCFAAHRFGSFAFFCCLLATAQPRLRDFYGLASAAAPWQQSMLTEPVSFAARRVAGYFYPVAFRQSRLLRDGEVRSSGHTKPPASEGETPSLLGRTVVLEVPSPGQSPAALAFGVCPGRFQCGFEHHLRRFGEPVASSFDRSVEGGFLQPAAARRNIRLEGAGRHASNHGRLEDCSARHCEPKQPTELGCPAICHLAGPRDGFLARLAARRASSRRPRVAEQSRSVQAPFGPALAAVWLERLWNHPRLPQTGGGDSHAPEWMRGLTAAIPRALGFHCILKSLRHESMAHLCWLRLSPAQTSFINEARAAGADLWQAPPAASLSVLLTGLAQRWQAPRRTRN